jgi:Questin oxidase-like
VGARGEQPVSTTVLDEAFERMAASSAFELPNGFVNHGPMGCEALAALGLDGRIDEWARRFERVPGPAVRPVPAPGLDWREALGDYHLLPEWIGHFQGAIDEDGWTEVISVWVPRLLPALAAKLFHGVIHVGHAVRALTVADTSARRSELARALGYWAARYQPGQSPADTRIGPENDVRPAVAAAAGYAARRYLTAPSILYLHGITGAMAIELIVDHLPPAAGEAALGQVGAEHAALYSGIEPVTELGVEGASAVEVSQAAANSRDVHQVKLVEACWRALAISGDRVFSAAAETVTGLGGPASPRKDERT